MLFVIVGIGRDKYAIPACDIVEIAPSAPSTSIPGTGRHITGLIQYRNRAIPLLDLGQLCGGAAGVETPTTRILVVKPQSGGGLLGIRAERVTSTTRMDDGAFEALSVTGAGYISGVFSSGGIILQRIDLHRLLREKAADLFAQEASPGG